MFEVPQTTLQEKTIQEEAKVIHIPSIPPKGPLSFGYLSTWLSIAHNRIFVSIAVIQI